MEVIYVEPEPITRDEVLKVFDAGNVSEICDALISVVYNDPDWYWLQEICVRLSKSQDVAVRGLAATCFGHIVRIHRQLDADTVVPVITSLLHDPSPKVVGRVTDAVDDINQFLNWHLDSIKL